MSANAKEEPSQVPVEAIVMQLLRDSAITICKSGSDVSLMCSTADDACALFEWLNRISNLIEFVEDSPCDCFDYWENPRQNVCDRCKLLGLDGRSA